MVKHDGGDVRGGCLRHRYGACKLSIPVSDYDDELVVVLRFRKRSEQVDGDFVEWSSRWE